MKFWKSENFTRKNGPQNTKDFFFFKYANDFLYSVFVYITSQRVVTPTHR